MTVSTEEFLCITRLTPQLLGRLHANGLLIPDRMSGDANRRGYPDTLIHIGRLFSRLLIRGFSDSQIKQLMPHILPEQDCYTTLKQHFREASSSLNDPQYARLLEEILSHEFHIREQLVQQNLAVEINTRPSGWIAAIRFRGKESDIALCASILQRKLQGNLNGAPFAMFHALPHTAGELDIEVGIPILRPVKLEAISVQHLESGTYTAVTTRDRTELLPRVYEMLIRHCYVHKITWQLPVWAVYVKGFPAYGADKPNKSITEIRFFKRI